MPTIIPKGISMVTSFRLFPVAPSSFKTFPLPFLRTFGVSISFSPFKYCAVSVEEAASSFGVPVETISPPFFPAPGPIRSEEHTSELQSRGHLVCRLLLEKKKTHKQNNHEQTYTSD